MKKLMKAFSMIFLISLSMFFISNKIVVQAASGDYYIESGTFNYEVDAQESLDKYLTQRGLWGEVKYFFRSGTFTERYQAQGIVDEMDRDGLWAEVIADGNSFRVSSGTFNYETDAQESLDKYLTQKGLWGEVKYFFRSGSFPERYQAQGVVDEMGRDGLWAQVIGDGDLPSKRDQVVSYAKSFLGVPYVYGGTSPSGFDCSGFVQYVYAHFGISIGRSTYDQINDGVTVSRDQLQPGDLVFFGSASAPHHVGMYIGEGEYIHAPKTGDVVKISSLSYRSDFCGARRIIY